MSGGRRKSQMPEQAAPRLSGGRKPRTSTAGNVPRSPVAGRSSSRTSAGNSPPRTPKSGRLSSRTSMAGNSPPKTPLSGRSSRTSVTMTPSPMGSSGHRQSFKPRSSSFQVPYGQDNRESVTEEVILESEESSEKDEEEERQKRKRKRIAIIVSCVLILILVIVIIAVVLSLLGTGDAPTNTPIDISKYNCGPINNETKPETKDAFMCDMLTTLTTNEETWLRSFAPSSKYGRTVLWMTRSDQTDFSKMPQENILERFVMVLFYFSTAGKDWYNRFEFLTQQHLCDWAGDSANVIRCAYKDRKVTDLGIPQNGMSGEIPTEIGYLTALTRIYLSINQLSGTIPSELFALTNLGQLYLDSNRLKGEIPTEIRQLSGLTTLKLNGNDLNGDLTEVCSLADPTDGEYDFHADCDTGRVICDCCKRCT